MRHELHHRLKDKQDLNQLAKYRNKSPMTTNWAISAVQLQRDGGTNRIRLDPIARKSNENILLSCSGMCPAYPFQVCSYGF